LVGDEGGNIREARQMRSVLWRLSPMYILPIQKFSFYCAIPL